MVKFITAIGVAALIVGLALILAAVDFYFVQKRAKRLASRPLAYRRAGGYYFSR